MRVWEWGAILGLLAGRDCAEIGVWLARSCPLEVVVSLRVRARSKRESANAYITYLLSL